MIDEHAAIIGLRVEQQRIANTLLMTGVDCYELYKEMLGRHSGLQIAIDKLTEMSKEAD